MSEDRDPRPTLMRRRWWVTFTVLLAGLVVVVWWVRQPDGDPVEEESGDGGSSTEGAAADGSLVTPDTFDAVGGGAWTRDVSPEAEARLDEAFGVFDDRPAGAEGTPAGAVYVVDDSTDLADQLVVAIFVSDQIAAVDAPELAAQTVSFNLGQEVASSEVDGGGGVACGYVPVVLEDESRAEQWFCAAAYGDAVANLLLPLSVEGEEDATAQATAFLTAARA
ncbi:hypothetical protein [Nocardioides zeae]|uniref:Uncharacterized protein n=1 Tax=Nocardioides zeae TaxID=1457234 RepID=A0AAJ1X2D4_9ACTN|nr:hypothetical protein [Nocardioides zeae]MDQ1105771.1 hypothetical protein [Nocardioides zeae]